MEQALCKALLPPAWLLHVAFENRHINEDLSVSCAFSAGLTRLELVLD